LFGFKKIQVGKF